MKKIKNALVILAGGIGSRFGKQIPKQFIQINGENLIHFFLKRIDTKNFGIILIVYKSSYFKYVKNLKSDFPSINLIFANAGKSRQLSSFNALKKLRPYSPKNVLIHDAARPFCSNKLVIKLLNKLNNNYSAIPYILNHDKKMISNNVVTKNIKFIQTPQGFNFKIIYDAHKKALLDDAKDDSALIINKYISLVKGEKLNIKITEPEDINYFKLFSKPVFKTGIGYDIHRLDLKSKTGLRLCGIKIDYNKLIGHSDADVGIHAICDSIFGALSMKDIGYYFSNNSLKWKNKNSVYFLKFARDNLIKNKYYIVNLDINFICEKPNINKHRKKMIKNLSSVLKIPNSIISIKATSNEKIGYIGEGLGIAAESIIQISNEKTY